MLAESALLNSMHCVESNQWLVTVGHVQLVDHDFSLVQTGDWLQHHQHISKWNVY
jgi:hypothetical protein